jgi:4-hydroxybenzoate polyprenyltransferase
VSHGPFGEHDRLLIGTLQATLALVLVLVGGQLDLGVAYLAGVGAAAALFVWQQAPIRERRPKGCFRAFLNNN